ncbi:hypothetical protein MRS44_004865 [Fusarium solani]|uniref:uncharacterized protein n=1 Tax=Fusarium solani TaxID=169388 RepID=UPI0032C42FD6|nr:hypothetical protein MRS44_004865 [Fusarium solani]
MSFPSTKPAQLSIRSFFQAKTPKYAPPPSAALSTPPPPPPAAAAPPPAVSPPSEQEEADETSTFELPPLPTSLPRSRHPPLDPAASGRFSRVITWAHDGAEPKVVGGVVCRIEPILDSKTHGQVPQNLYIQSLCLLSPYRSLGLINAAVDNIIATAVSDSSLDVTSVTAHVWTENEEGLKWYEGRGFKKDDQPIRGYYLKLRPDSAWLVHRPVGASVRSSLPSSSSSAAPPSIPASTTAAVATTSPSGRSYQNQRPETEWNDMPEDMVGGLLVPPGRKPLREPGSGASSRSSSTARKKRDRSYPAAAFGS